MNDTSYQAFFIGPPVTPKLKFPANNKLEVDLSTKFEWYPAGFNILYNFSLALDSNFNNIVFDSSNITNTYLNIDEVASNSTFYWKIIASDTAGLTKSSQVWKFSTAKNKYIGINKIKFY